MTGPGTAEALFLAAAVALLALVLVYLHRVAAGPTVFDRILGLSGFGVKTTVVLLLAGAAYGRLDMFVDLSLGYALLNFVGALAAARYFERSAAGR
jgi:multicomponent Na+:H+ antiporter subunit F